MSTLLIKPLMSEKSASAQSQGLYAFLVRKVAGKIAIKKEIERLYKVRVLTVRTLIQPNKRKARYTKRRVIEGKRSGYKKAYVQLTEGDAIDFYAAVK